MYVCLLSVLLIVDRLRHLACRALPYLVSAVLAVVFLPMVLLGASGLFVWRRLVARPDAPSGQGSPSRQRRWLVGLWLLAALQYGGAAIVLRADPLLLYLLVQLSWLSAVLLSILEPGQGALVAGPVSEGAAPCCSPWPSPRCSPARCSWPTSSPTGPASGDGALPPPSTRPPGWRCHRTSPGGRRTASSPRPRGGAWATTPTARR